MTILLTTTIDDDTLSRDQGAPAPLWEDYAVKQPEMKRV
jgi:hypothetical protein